MKKFIGWIKKFYLWVLGGISSLIITIALVMLKVRKSQKEKLEQENLTNLIKIRQGKTARASGETKGKDAVLAKEEQAVVSAIKESDETINEIKKPGERSAAAIVDILNAAYGRRNDK